MPRLPDSIVEDWYARYQDGETIKELAKSLDRDVTTLYAAFSVRGLPLIKRSPRMPKRVDPLLVEEMWAFYESGKSLAAVARKYKRCPTSVRQLLTSRGYTLRPLKNASQKRTAKGTIAPIQPKTEAEIEAMIQAATSIIVPPDLKCEWRKWSLARRVKFIARIRARLNSPNDRPKGPFSTNVVPFEYGTPEAHNLAGDTRKIKPSSQGVIWGGKLWFWIRNTGYVRGPWKPGMPSRILSRVIWEYANNREIPASHVVQFKDGNPNNLAVENLQLKSRNGLARENQSKHLQAKSRAGLGAILKHNEHNDENDITQQLIGASSSR